MPLLCAIAIVRPEMKVIRGDSSVLLPGSSLHSARASKNYNLILFRTILHPPDSFVSKNEGMAEVADKKRRAEKIRNAKAELEAGAKAAAEARLKAEAEAAEKREAEGRRKPGPKAAPPSTEPDAKTQKNFTDPDSRIMNSKDGFVQAYNAQAAVDGEAQIIVAHDVTQSAGDCGQLIPMTDAIEINLGRKPEQLSADAGYCSEANLKALENRNIDAYGAPGGARDAVAGPPMSAAASAPSCFPI